MLNKQILLTLFHTMFWAVVSQGQHLDWYHHLTGTGNEYAREIANDPAGNLYVFGNFTGTVDFDPGPDATFLTAGTTGQHLFLQKLTPKGQLLWVRQLGGPTVEYYQVSFDSIGNAYILTVFKGTIDLDPSPAEALVSAGPDGNVSLTKLDAMGDFVWGKRFDCKEYPMEPAIDQQGNILLAFYLTGTADFEPGPGVTTLTAQGTSVQTVVVKLDSNGAFVWAGAFFGANNRPFKIATDPTGKVYVQGVFNGPVDFDPGANTYPMTAAALSSPYYTSMYIVQLSPEGGIIWGRQINAVVSYNDFFVAGLQVDNQGNVLSCGHFFSADFDPGPGNLVLHNPPGIVSIFCFKLTASGDLAWARQVGSEVANNIAALALEVDQYDNCYITGHITGQVDMDPSMNVALSGPKRGGRDCFLLKLDATGTYRWSRRFGGKGNEGGSALSVDLQQNIYLGGTFTMVADFGENPGDHFLTPIGTQDFFVLKLDEGLIFDGFAFWDLNNNELRDSGEPGVPNLLLALSNQPLYATTNALGRYTIYTDIVGDTLRPVLPRPYWVFNPAFALPDSTHTNTDFAVTIQPGIRDVSVVATHVKAFRPGFKTTVFVTVENLGSEVLDSASLLVDNFHLLPAAPEVISAIPVPALQTPEKVLWKIGRLQPYVPVTYELVLKTPNNTPVGQPLDFQVSVSIPNDIDSTNNQFKVNAIVQASFDPNDKQVSPASLPAAQADSTRFRYVIRFQNTGSLAADFIILRDTLPASLDPESIQMLNASHPFTWRLRRENILEVRFDSIFLPASSSNLDASQGFLAFSLKPHKHSLAVGDTVSNRAGIYFDYNPPIITNVAHTMVMATSATISAQPTNFDFTLSPNPVMAGTPIWLGLPDRAEAWQVAVEDLRGAPIQVLKPAQTSQIQLNKLPPGTYVVSVYAGNAVRSKLLVVH